MVTTFRRLARAGKLRGALMSACSAGMLRGGQLGLGAGNVLDAVRRAMPQEIREEMKRSESHLEEIEPVLPLLLDNRLLPSDVRSNLRKLSTTVRGMQEALEEPRSPPFFINRTRELR